MKPFILVIILLTVIFKALGDALNYRFNVEKNPDKRKKFGIIYHLFALAAVAVPFLLLFIKGQVNQWYVFAGFMYIYFGFFDIVYNLASGRNILYIGQTDAFDRFIGKMFKKPFHKTILLIIRWIVLFYGVHIIINLA